VLVGSSSPMFSSAGAHPLALHIYTEKKTRLTPCAWVPSSLSSARTAPPAAPSPLSHSRYAHFSALITFQVVRITS
jgi:hypothetical protein